MKSENNLITLYKLRSVTACLSQGYALLMGNFKNLFLATGCTLLPLAFSYGFLHIVQGVAVQLIVFVVFLFLMVCYLAQLLSLIKRYSQSGFFSSKGIAGEIKEVFTFQRFVTVLCFVFSVSLLCVLTLYLMPLLFSSLQVLYSPYIVMGAGTLLSILVCLPLVYALLHSQLDERPLSVRLGKGMKLGLYSYGSIFGIVLVGVLAVIATQFFMGWVSITLTLAFEQGAQSAANGGIVKLPYYVKVIYPMSKLLNFLVLQMTLLGTWLSLTYLYGSITVRESEREEFEQLQHEV